MLFRLKRWKICWVCWAAVYFLVLKPKQGKKVPADLDDFDLEDEEEYLTADEETKELKNIALTVKH